MSQNDKLQRWVDLIHVLLSSKRSAYTLRDLRARVPGYSQGDPESVRRTFERDKQELRQLGIAIDLCPVAEDGGSAYAIDEHNFYLPLLEITDRLERGTSPAERARHNWTAGQFQISDHELAILADAASHAASLGDPVLAREARFAIGKLRLKAPSVVEAATPNVRIQAPPDRDGAELAALDDAVARRKEVTFDYYGINRDQVETRRVHPYGIAFTVGNWYLHGRDVERDALRKFRVSRIRDVKVNPKNSLSPDYTVPESFSLEREAVERPSWQLGSEPTLAVTVRCRGNSNLVRSARDLGSAVVGDDSLVEYQVNRREPFLRWLLSLAGAAVPVSPSDIVIEYGALVSQALLVARES